MKVFGALFVCLLLVGCQSMSTHDGGTRPPTAQIDVLRGGATPMRKYREIGTIGDEGKMSQQSGIEAEMIRKAKQIGGNAIIFSTPAANGKEKGSVTGENAATYSFKARVVIYE